MDLKNIRIKARLDDSVQELEEILDNLPIEITCENKNIELEAHWSSGKHLNINCPEGQTYTIRTGNEMYVGGSSQYSTSLFDMREKPKHVYSGWIHILTGGYKQPSSIFPILSPL